MHSQSARQSTYDPEEVNKYESIIKEASKRCENLQIHITSLLNEINTQKRNLREDGEELKKLRIAHSAKLYSEQLQIKTLQFGAPSTVFSETELEKPNYPDPPEKIDNRNINCVDSFCFQNQMGVLEKNMAQRQEYIGLVYNELQKYKKEYDKYAYILHNYEKTLNHYLNKYSKDMAHRDKLNVTLRRNFENHYRNRSNSALQRKKHSTIRSINAVPTTLLEAFEIIKQSIDTAYKYGSFDDGCSQTVRITSKLEIVLMLDKTFIKKKDTEITIRFRIPTHIKSCVKMTIRSSEKDTIVIEKINLNNCSELNVNKHCFMMLALMLCTFLSYTVVEVKDFDHYDNEHPRSSYREQTFTKLSNQPQPNKYMYSHNYSYFDEYGFFDSIYNEERPMMINCTAENSQDQCTKLDDPMSNQVHQFTDIDDKNMTFIAMHKYLDTSNRLIDFLRSIVLTNDHQTFIDMNDFCKFMECTTHGCYRSLTSFLATKTTNVQSNDDTTNDTRQYNNTRNDYDTNSYDTNSYDKNSYDTNSYDKNSYDRPIISGQALDQQDNSYVHGQKRFDTVNDSNTGYRNISNRYNSSQYNDTSNQYSSMQQQHENTLNTRKQYGNQETQNRQRQATRRIHPSQNNVKPTKASIARQNHNNKDRSYTVKFGYIPVLFPYTRVN